ncbi:hypothetical protein [Clostridium sp.]|uniref:hypothetical protein n=1 Tax=Clostridium sp. TaxID=1506 RepID=UPI0026DCB806|nr:hypothetical protein [Clostridium sp.]MDO5039792.1 hypothetical protein [Clostridium sp.]
MIKILILILLVCLFALRVYISYKIKLDYFLSGMYLLNIATFIIISLALALNSNSRNELFLINLIMIMGIIIFSWALVISIKNIRSQYINTNKLILFLINIVCIVTIIPAVLISTIIYIIDVGLFIKHIIVPQLNI